MKALIHFPWLILALAGGFNVAWGAERYVATTGSDTNPGTFGAPFRTIAKGAGVLQPGDTLYVRTGTYREWLTDLVAEKTIPSGTPSAPVTLAAFPGEIVIIKPDPTPADATELNQFVYAVFRFANSSYIILDGFVIDAANTGVVKKDKDGKPLLDKMGKPIVEGRDAIKITASGNFVAHDIIVRNCEVKNAPGQGILLTESADSNQFLNLDVHDNGTDAHHDHGFYIETSHNLVENCRIHRNRAYGVHIYSGTGSPNGNTVRGNHIYDNCLTGFYGAGIIFGTGDGNIAINNLIWNNAGGIDVNFSVEGKTGLVSHSEIYNNTISANKRYDAISKKHFGYGIYADTSAMNTRIKNNIVVNNVFYDNEREVFDAGTSTTKASNLTSDESGNLPNSDPRFVDAATNDFHLLVSSPAINTGVTIPQVDKDIDGVSRPQGSAYDIGVYECQTPKTDFNADNKPDYLLFRASDGHSGVWFMNGPAFVSTANGPTLPAGWSIVGVADFNGDGKPDYLLFNSGTRRTFLWYLSGVTTLGGDYGPTLPAGWSVVGSGDFNGDGKPDYALYHAGTRQTFLWYLNGGASLGGAYGPTLPAGWSVVGIGDFNGDGKPDFALYHANTHKTFLWYLNGAATLGGDFGPTLTAGWSVLGSEDFNGDGKPDYVLFNSGTRRTFLWYLNGAATLGGAYGPTVPAGWDVIAR